MSRAKKPKIGFVNLDISDLDGMSFQDMNFFQSYIPQNSELVGVRFYHENGYYNESDRSWISIEWKQT